jgi:hypothetical protein
LVLEGGQLSIQIHHWFAFFGAHNGALFGHYPVVNRQYLNVRKNTAESKTTVGSAVCNSYHDILQLFFQFVPGRVTRIDQSLSPKSMRYALDLNIASVQLVSDRLYHESNILVNVETAT